MHKNYLIHKSSIFKSSHAFSYVCRVSKLQKTAMASAVWLGSSKLARKSRAVFERPQPASPAHKLRLPKQPWLAEENGDNVFSSLSTPHFTFTNEETGGESSLTPPLLYSEDKVAAGSPALPSGARRSPLTLLSTSEIRVEPLEGGVSAVSLLGDDIPLCPSSAGLGKDWRQMQVCIRKPAPPPDPIWLAARKLVRYTSCTCLFPRRRRRLLTG